MGIMQENTPTKAFLNGTASTMTPYSPSTPKSSSESTPSAASKIREQRMVAEEPTPRRGETGAGAASPQQKAEVQQMTQQLLTENLEANRLASVLGQCVFDA